VISPPSPATGRTAEPRRIEVNDGTVLTIDILRWNEGWDFDCPVAVLRPVVRFSPNGEHAEEMVEDLCGDAAVDGYLISEEEEGGLIDRQYPLKSLKRRWAASRRGVEFPVLCYTASRYRVRFFIDTDADADDVLAFEAVEVPRG
jgi:hypothetical protein